MQKYYKISITTNLITPFLYNSSFAFGEVIVVKEVITPYGR